ncbi:hypothetical protein [Klenkia brasiliensis]|uniref:Uncharacterized protein n=1 Tax=Klenkia brasiliensis TaxID=333142 RepID=A0A1G7R7W9_9ACTN|nr:hypothetical protein [Klenkia brasiliensis]SDG06862.1 hypothetical protein SAMN05660324_1794 [Klenkia brasiliensis]
MAEPTDPRTPATSEQETTVHPGQDTDRRDTAVLPDGTGTWAPPAPAVQPAPRRRSPDLLALTAGVVFCLVAVLGLVGTSLPGWVFGGGFVAVVLVVAGVGLLVTELRKPRG